MKPITSRILSTLFAVSATLSVQADPWSESYRFESQKQYAQAIDAIASISANHEFAQLRIAYLNHLQGRYEDSIKGYLHAFELNPKSFDALLGLTLPLMAQGRWGEAARWSKRVIEQCAWNYTAHIRLLTCEVNLRDWPVVLEHARELTQRYPSDATVLAYLARGENGAGTRAEACRVYQRLLELYPGHKEATDYLKANVP